ncbi:MAG TPA: serine hydrolase domain-containing protein [Bryobacteraceae bacterium]|nr:serine hydrolase domain-containing protein [Bryobacteraceae bacterium]
MVGKLLLASVLLPILHADLRSDAVDKLLAPLHSEHAPGCAVGIMQNGQFVYKTAFGLADLEQGTPITTATSFNVASMSKQFTAAALYFLVEAGQVKLTDPVRRFIPELPAYADDMTIGDLVHHTSGLRDITPLLELSGRLGDWQDIPSSLNLIASQSGLNFPPGTDYEYTNSDYLLLGLVIERVSGISLASFAEERIFRPLEMINSQFRDKVDKLKNRASGYGARGDQYRRISLHLLGTGDGGLYTSVDDLLQWDQNFYSGKLGGRAFLEFMETRGRLRSGEPVHYASGLQFGRFRGLPTVSHDGWLPGFRSEMVRFPAQHLSVACLCNRGDAEVADLAREIARVYLWDRVKHGPHPSNLDYASSIFPELAGVWESKQGFIVRTWSGVDSLTVELPEGQYRLTPLNHQQMYADTGGFRLVLTALSHDRVKVAWDGWPPIIYDRLNTVMPKKEDLASLAGEYRSDDARVRYRVYVSEQGRLTMTNGAGWRWHLEPVGSDRFVLGAWSLRFVRTADGQVQGLGLHRARLWNLWFDRSD